MYKVQITFQIFNTTYIPIASNVSHVASELIGWRFVCEKASKPDCVEIKAYVCIRGDRHVLPK